MLNPILNVQSMDPRHFSRFRDAGLADPRSHRIDLEKNSAGMNIAFNHQRYKQHVLDIIDRHGLECRTPALSSGDVRFWNSKTIHGSVTTTKPSSSRSSFTAHFLAESSRFLQWQSRIKRLNIDRVNGVDVHRPKDLASAKNRAILWAETTFPQTFQMIKKIGVRLLTA